MTEDPARFGLDDAAMRAWLALAAAEGPDEPDPPTAATLPPIGYGWRPGHPGSAAAAGALVRLAPAAGVLACPDLVTVALQDPGGEDGTCRVLVTVTPPGGRPLTVTSARPWREVCPAGLSGPDAAARILAEVTATANGLLASLDSWRPAVAGAALR
jgi:hypothetical protein